MSWEQEADGCLRLLISLTGHRPYGDNDFSSIQAIRILWAIGNQGLVCEQERDQGEGQDAGSDSRRQTLSYIVSPPLDVYFNPKCPPSLTLGFFTVSRVYKFIKPNKPGLFCCCCFTGQSQTMVLKEHCACLPNSCGTTANGPLHRVILAVLWHF